MIPKRFHYFTHGGIVAIENGEPVVYEVSGEIVTFPFHSEGCPRQRERRGPPRRPSCSTPPRTLYAEVTDLSSRRRRRKRSLHTPATRSRARLPFDPYFRWDDHSSLFCTELIELAMRAGGARSRASSCPSTTTRPWPWHPVARRPGQRRAARRHVLRPGALRRRAVSGSSVDRTEAYAYFEAKRELHRRFQRNQRLGFLFKLSGNGNIDVRPEVAGLRVRRVPPLRRRGQLRSQPGDPRITREVRSVRRRDVRSGARRRGVTGPSAVDGSSGDFFFTASSRISNAMPSRSMSAPPSPQVPPRRRAPRSAAARTAARTSPPTRGENISKLH